MIANKFALCLATASVAGRSTHPLPEDRTINSFSIVQHVRCETEQALKRIILQEFKSPPPGQEKPDPHAVRLAELLEQDRRIMLDYVVIDGLHPHHKALWQSYGSTVLAYNFKFSSKEDNKADGTLKLSFPVPVGVLGVDIGSKNNLSRLGEREITVSETIDQLGDSGVCKKYEVNHRGDIAYPISGKIGMYEVLYNFYRVSQSVKTVNTYTDRIEFETELSGNVNPTLTLTSGSDVSEVSGELKASRKDTHQLLFTVKVDEKKGTSFLFEPTKNKQAASDPDEPSIAETKQQAVDELKRAQQRIFLQNIDNAVTKN